MRPTESIVMVSVVMPTVLILAIPRGLSEQQQAVARLTSERSDKKELD